MKNLIKGIVLLVASITLGGNYASAESDLDTIYNDELKLSSVCQKLEKLSKIYQLQKG